MYGYAFEPSRSFKNVTIMAQTLTEWLNGEVKELQKLPVGDLSNTFFFRDPIRPNFIDHEHFYSPADGTILY